MKVPSLIAIWMHRDWGTIETQGPGIWGLGSGMLEIGSIDYRGYGGCAGECRITFICINGIVMSGSLKCGYTLSLYITQPITDYPFRVQHGSISMLMATLMINRLTVVRRNRIGTRTGSRFDRSANLKASMRAGLTAFIGHMLD